MPGFQADYPLKNKSTFSSPSVSDAEAIRINAGESIQFSNFRMGYLYRLEY